MIKHDYRAWLLKENKMVQVKSIHFGTQKIMYGYSDNKHSYGNKTCRLADCLLLQYSGLRDDNNWMIFEGDILKLKQPHDDNEYMAIVYFGNPNGLYNWGWQLVFKQPFNLNPDILCWVGMNEVGVSCEVIGNIFENPEAWHKEDK